MMNPTVQLVLALATLVRCQRPSFAGSRPIGYPEMATTEGLGNRFGEADGTTQRLPIEANGDRELVDRLSKLPIDQQPFWLINWQALEAHRQNPQTYPQKPNPFIDPNLNTGNSNTVNSGNSGNPVNSNSGNPINSNSGNLGTANRGSFSSGTIATPRTTTATPNVANRNSFDTSSTSNSANQNAANSNFSALEDRFAGGIEPNRYYETKV